MSEPLASTRNVMHPREVAEMKDLRTQKMAMLGGNTSIGPGSTQLSDLIASQLQDKQKTVDEVRAIDATLARDAPESISPDRLDEAVALEDELRTSWLDGMPSQEQMRRNMAGAVDKHRLWEKNKKIDVLKWKHLRRRLHASGISDFGLDDEADVSNIEKFRPRSSLGDLTDAQIPQKSVIKLPPLGAAPAAVMSGDQEAALAAEAPEVLDRMALLDNEQRATVLALVDEELARRAVDAQVAEPKKPRKPSAYNLLQKEAGALGIHPIGKKAGVLRELIAAAKEA